MNEKITQWCATLGLDLDALDIPALTDQEMAGALMILLVHKGYNDDVWGNKRARYWGAFAEKLELALGATNLNEFASLFAREMSSSIGRNKHQRQVAVEVANAENNETILDTIRREHEMLVTLAQVMQNMIKSKYDQREETS